MIEKRTIAVCRPASVNAAHAQPASSTSATAVKQTTSVAQDKKILQRSTVTEKTSTISNVKAVTNRLQVHEDAASDEDGENTAPTATASAAAAAPATSATETLVVAAESKVVGVEQKQKATKKTTEVAAVVPSITGKINDKENIAPGETAPLPKVYIFPFLQDLLQ